LTTLERPITPERSLGGRVDALDGIRTVAVFLVVLFHVSAPRMAAGFIGVDVFFVLSGYLITSGLSREVTRNGRIALRTFWVRRFKRLMPAAVLVIAVTLVWAVVWADFYRRGPLATDAWWTVVYLANWRFISSASYFSNDGTSSPLLHMWSLAVEEQFYLFWPLVVAAVATLVGRHHGGGRAVRVARLVSLVVVVASAVALWARYDPSAPERAYMGTDTKAFEPMLGALLALTVHERGVAIAVRRLALPLSAVGVVVMVALFTRLDGPAPLYFHGGALLFSIAAGLVIVACAADPSTPLARLLSLSPVSYLGRISYGIYLWHWPYAVWLGTDHTTFSWWRATLVIILTVATASASYHFLEMPVRRGRVADWLSPRRTLAAATALVVAFGVWTTVAGGTR
jgi:peptidoglycan/LPS O-acetylase OafA/YrhL